MTINGKLYSNILLVFALESEAGKEFESFNKLFVGVGKIKATYHLVKAIQKSKPESIINLGTAGSTVFAKEGILVQMHTRFIQRDMDEEHWVLRNSEMQFSEERIFLNMELKQAISRTDLRFRLRLEMEHINPNIMSSIWKLLRWRKSLQEKIDFLCLKYISDGADGNAADDWTQEVKKASIALKKELDSCSLTKPTI